MGYEVKVRLTIGLLASVLLLAFPAEADWLVTSEGDTVETQGPWQVKGRMIGHG